MTDSDFGNRALCLCSPKSVNSNKVAIARAIEEEMGNRQGQRTDLGLPNNCSEVEPGKESREIAAEKVAIARAIEEEMKATERRGRPSNEIPDNCPELNGKESREIAAGTTSIKKRASGKFSGC